MPRVLSLSVCLLLLGACKQQYAVLDDKGGVGSTTGETTPGETGTGTTGTEVEETHAWDEAELVILTPHSADWLDLGATSDFEAVVYDAEGNETDFDEISWSSDVDSAWTPSGSSFGDDSLDAGTHALTAKAILPNGNRLVYTIGGVHVQHEDAGIYAGNLAVDTTFDYNGTEYTTTCLGAATVVVDIWGETGVGDSVCTISLLGYDLDATFDFALELADGAIGGSSAVDFSFFTYDIDTEGDVGDGVLTADFSDTVYGYVDLAGELDLTRITRDTEASG